MDKKPSVTEEQVLQFLQMLLAVLGTLAASFGWVTHDQVIWISGSILTLVGAGWGIWQSRPAGIVKAAGKLVRIDTATQRRMGVKKPTSPEGQSWDSN